MVLTGGYTLSEEFGCTLAVAEQGKEVGCRWFLDLVLGSVWVFRWLEAER